MYKECYCSDDAAWEDGSSFGNGHPGELGGLPAPLAEGPRSAESFKECLTARCCR